MAEYRILPSILTSVAATAATGYCHARHECRVGAVPPSVTKKGLHSPLFGSDQPTQSAFCKRYRVGTAYDDVIQCADLDQRQCILESLGQPLIRFAGFRISARMIVRNDDRRRIEPQCRFDDFARIYRRPVDGALKHLDVLNQTALGVEKQHCEHFMFNTSQFGLQILFKEPLKTPDLSQFPHIDFWSP